MKETLDVLSNPEAMRQLAKSRAAIADGEVLDADQLATLMNPPAAPTTDR